MIINIKIWQLLIIKQSDYINCASQSLLLSRELQCYFIDQRDRVLRAEATTLFCGRSGLTFTYCT